VKQNRSWPRQDLRENLNGRRREERESEVVVRIVSPLFSINPWAAIIDGMFQKQDPGPFGSILRLPKSANLCPLSDVHCEPVTQRFQSVVRIPNAVEKGKNDKGL
jgi:hypothetical protein